MPSDVKFATPWCRITTLVVFLMFAMSLSFPGGYSLGPVLLLILSAVLLLPKRWRPRRVLKMNVSGDDRWLMLAFLFYFAVLGAEIVWFGLRARELDKPLRFLLAIPVLLILLRCPPRVVWLWRGIAIAAISAGIIAIYQKLWLGAERANGFLYPIQFGDLAMLLGMLCLAGIAWGREQPHRNYWVMAFVLGGALGMAASLLSGSRGGWIGAPLILLMLMRNYTTFLSRAQWIGVMVGIVICGVAVVSLPSTGVEERISRIKTDLTSYQQGENNTSLGARFDLWRMATHMYGQRPIFGYGTYGFVDMRDALHEKFGYGQGVIDQNLQSAHNEVLDAAAKRGTLGILALLGV